MTLASDSRPLSGKSVLITGASGAIGHAVAKMCLDNGAFVFAHARDENKLQTLLEQWPERCMPLLYDVTDEKAVSGAFRTIHKRQSEQEVGAFYGLVNNAGIMQQSALMTTTLTQLQSHLSVNLVSAYQHMQLASRLMAKHKNGAMINILSQAGELGSKGLSAYSASKAGLGGATKSIAKELASLHIRVNAVSPGFIESALISDFDTHARDEIVKNIGLGRVGSADEVAHAVMYFLSPQASYTSGQILAVDGLFTP